MSINFQRFLLLPCCPECDFFIPQNTPSACRGGRTSGDLFVPEEFTFVAFTYTPFWLVSGVEHPQPGRVFYCLARPNTNFTDTHVSVYSFSYVAPIRTMIVCY